MKASDDKEWLKEHLQRLHNIMGEKEHLLTSNASFHNALKSVASEPGRCIHVVYI